jgi:hypothetical protein
MAKGTDAGPPQVAAAALWADRPSQISTWAWGLFYVVAWILGAGAGAAIIGVLLLAVDHH